jgi:hypothetical protein
VRDAAEYLAFVKALIVANQQVHGWTVVREEAQGDLGLLRYRLTLRDGSLLEVFERFRVIEDQVQVSKYSFHWQGEAGQLIKRWDNVAHHPEVDTFPHHLHDGKEDRVEPHGVMTVKEVLTAISKQ